MMLLTIALTTFLGAKAGEAVAGSAGGAGLKPGLRVGRGADG